MTLSMRNKIMLAIAIVSMIYGASTFTAGAIATTDAGGRAMTLVVSAIDASGCIVPDSESIKVDQGLSSRQVLEFGFSYYQSYRVFI